MMNNDNSPMGTMVVPFDPAHPELQRFNGKPDTQENRDAYRDAKMLPSPMAAIPLGGRNTRSRDECCIDTYKNNAAYLGEKNAAKGIGGNNGCRKCKKSKGFAAHHGMVDYPFRTGGSYTSQHRAPGVPSYDNAWTICVRTHKRPGSNAGDDDESNHENIHSAFEEGMGKAQHDGTVTFSNVRRLSFDGINNLSPLDTSDFCKELYKNMLREQYPLPGDMLLRAKQKPTPEDPVSGDVWMDLKEAWGW